MIQLFPGVIITAEGIPKHFPSIGRFFPKHQKFTVIKHNVVGVK
jgi:hypothetical protein